MTQVQQSAKLNAELINLQNWVRKKIKINEKYVLG